MTGHVEYTTDGPLVAKCPRCELVDRVDVVPAPAWNPDARYWCQPCNLSFTGAAGERDAELRYVASKTYQGGKVAADVRSWVELSKDVLNGRIDDGQ